ncbi:MAG: HEAT repeat domain-containing protein [Planctomycetia bacterium]
MSRTLLVGFVLITAAWLASGCQKAAPRATTPPTRPAPAASATSAQPAADGHPSLDDLRKTLTTAEDSAVRVSAIDALGTYGEGAEAALDELVKATTDSEPRVRWRAARTIGLIGVDAISAMPRLVAMLGDPDPIAAAQAAAAIRLIRGHDRRADRPEQDASLYESAIEPLFAATVHADPRVRRAAVHAIQSLDLPDSDLAARLGKILADSQPSVILPALHTLADMDGAAVPVFIEALANPKARYWAAVGLTEVGPEAAPAVGALTTLAATGEPEERMQAMLALAAIGPAAVAAAPAVLEALQTNDEGVLRFSAAFAAGKIGLQEADGPLATMATGDDPLLATVAAWARSKINRDDASLRTAAVESLRAALSSDRPRVRVAAVSGLSDMADLLDAPTRRALAVEFLETLRDPDPTVGNRGGAALIRLGGDAIDTLRGAMADAPARQAILEILAAIGPKAAAAEDEIVAALSADDPAVRGEAAVTLAAIGPDAAQAVPALERILADGAEEKGVRYSAAYALGRIGPDAVSAIDELRALMASEDELMATVAVWAILKIEPGSSEHFETAIPLLRKALRSDNDLARLEAAVALGEIGASAEAAIPILEVVSDNDPVRAVRSAATEALSRIRGG